jgi:superfamily I DNA/RNA helicase
VVVTLNYRLGALGFLWLGDLDERYRLEMQPVRKAGPAPEVTRHVDQDSEAAHVVRSLVDRRQNNALDYRDIAILYRTNAYSRGIEDALIACGVPYHITGGTSFYNRKEVRDMISYLQLTVDPHCPAGTEAAKRLLNVASKRHAARTRSLGQGFVKQVEELAERKVVDLDAPFTWFTRDAWRAIPSDATLRRAVGAAADAPVERITLDYLLRNAVQNYDGTLDQEHRAARFRQLSRTLQRELTNITVVRVGTVQIRVFILGVTRCGTVAGLETLSIET